MIAAGAPACPAPGWLVWDGRHGRDTLGTVLSVVDRNLTVLEASDTCTVRRWLAGRLALCELDGTTRIVAR